MLFICIIVHLVLSSSMKKYDIKWVAINIIISMYALLLEWLHVTMNNWIASYQFVSFLYTWIKIIFDTGYLLHCSINYCFTRITPAVKHNAKIIFTAPRLFLLPFFIDEDTARKPITQMNNIFNIVPNWLFYGSDP